VAPIQWLSDNEGIYTALETVIAAEKLNLAPITTPVASPESNGMSEAFVNTLRRDYLDGADLGSAARVLEQISAWIANYNEHAPHSGLGVNSGRRVSHEIGVRAPPRRVPSSCECGFCDIGVADCPDRLEGAPEPNVEHDMF